MFDILLYSLTIPIKTANAIGVSKRSCPLCSRLLALLQGRSLPDVVMPPSHRSFFACALPPWLPCNIIQQMVEFIWIVLKRMLEEVVDEASQDTLIPERMRTISTNSLDSDSFSSDSEADYGQYMPDVDVQDL